MLPTKSDKVAPDDGLSPHTSGTTVGSRRRNSLTKGMSIIVSRTQVSTYKLDVDPLMPLVIAGGVILAACAGMVNAIAFVIAESLVTHVTGSVSKVALHSVAEQTQDAMHVLLLVVFFILGSVFSGCFIRRSAVKMADMGYGIAMTSSSFLLVLAMLLYHSSQELSAYILSLACGLQNGIMSSYSGSAIRTTHMTGIATDIGLITGRHLMSFFQKRCFGRCRCCEHRKVADDEAGDERKLMLLVLLLFSFIAGVAAGSALATAAAELSLLVPAIVSFIAGIAYMIWQHNREELIDKVAEVPDPDSPTAQPLKCVAAAEMEPPRQADLPNLPTGPETAADEAEGP